MNKAYTYHDDLMIAIGEGDPRDVTLEVDYRFFPARKAPIPHGEYQPIDPDEPAHVEIDAVRLTKGFARKRLDCPDWLADLITEDMGLDDLLLKHADEEARAEREDAA